MKLGSWKCVNFEGSLREDILVALGPMEIREYATLVNKCRLVEEYNEKLRITKYDANRKRLAPESQGSKHAPPLKKQFPPSGHEGKQLQRPTMRQRCLKYGKDHGGRPCLAE